jgi:hypothetical protein
MMAWRRMKIPNPQNRLRERRRRIEQSSRSPKIQASGFSVPTEKK